MNSQLDAVLSSDVNNTGASLSALYYAGRNTMVTHEGIRNLRALAIGKVGVLAEDLIADIDDLETYISSFKLFDKPSYHFPMIDSIGVDLINKIYAEGEFLFNVAGSKFYSWDGKYYVSSVLHCHAYNPFGEVSQEVIDEQEDFLEHVKYTNDTYKTIKDGLSDI